MVAGLAHPLKDGHVGLYDVWNDAESSQAPLPRHVPLRYRHGDVKVAICVTCYDETLDLVQGTLDCIHDNVCKAKDFFTKEGLKLEPKDFVVRAPAGYLHALEGTSAPPLAPGAVCGYPLRWYLVNYVCVCVRVRCRGHGPRGQVFLVFDGRPSNFQTSVAVPNGGEPQTHLFRGVKDLETMMLRDKMLDHPDAVAARNAELFKLAQPSEPDKWTASMEKTETAAHIFEVRCCGALARVRCDGGNSGSD